jgi:tetratricopeptide (TPR) repeat protein
MDKVDFSPGAFSHADVLIHLHKHGIHVFSFFIAKYSNDQVKQLQAAIEALAQRAAQGEAVVCSENPDDYKSQLDDFQAKTAAWRALATKPAPGDEVYKDRLLAEDAIKNKDLTGAIKYYEQGIAAEPTWDQGWYNAALVYAEQKDYFNAALSMRHYVLLDPNASDAQAAKDNIILWEAKAEEASGPASGTVSRH